MYNGIIKNKFYIGMFAAAFFFGLLLPVLRTETVQANLGEIDYADSGDSLEKALIKFHSQMNETTNFFLNKLVTGSNPNVSYPASDEECSSSNVSTYCLAVLLNGELTKFEKEISTRGDSFKEADDLTTYTIDQAVKEAAARANLIDDEIKSAEQTLELTLATYNEIQNVYPLHKKLYALIKSLETYRSGLSNIRNIVEIYPSKFNDATTIECK